MEGVAEACTVAGTAGVIRAAKMASAYEGVVVAQHMAVDGAEMAMVATGMPAKIQ